MTEKQIYAWLRLKMQNYTDRIGSVNSYGSRKKLITLSKELLLINDQLLDYLNNQKK